VRLDQARRVADLVGGPAERTVLLADLNAEPGSPELRVLSERLVDCWGGGRGGATFPAPLPRWRMDYVLRSAPVRRLDAGTVRSLAARIASDHLPVVASVDQRIGVAGAADASLP
jgi:endonuclease/exonuclease/phosphatase family metal-dependent hydrolase